MRYSVPVFLTNPSCANPQPQLSWQITTDGDATLLRVTNSGEQRAQLASLIFTNSKGKEARIVEGLLGYVLPGVSRSFAIAQPASDFAGGGKLKVMVNGASTEVTISVANQNS